MDKSSALLRAGVKSGTPRTAHVAIMGNLPLAISRDTSIKELNFADGL